MDLNERIKKFNTFLTNFEKASGATGLCEAVRSAAKVCFEGVKEDAPWMDSKGDRLAESYVAITGKPAADVKVDDETVIAKLKELQSHMADVAAKNPKMSEGVKNIYADFDEKMTDIIYKFTQFDG